MSKVFGGWFGGEKGSPSPSEIEKPCIKEINKGDKYL